MNIRQYHTDDKFLLLELFQLNTPAYFSVDEEKDFIHYLNNELEQYFVIELNNKIAGCGGINFSDNKQTGKISWDIFHPQYQNQGLGTALLKHRISILQSMPIVKCIIVRTSQQAYKFYQKNGFKTKEIVKDYWAKGYDLYLMEYI